MARIVATSTVASFVSAAAAVAATAVARLDGVMWAPRRAHEASDVVDAAAIDNAPRRALVVSPLLCPSSLNRRGRDGETEKQQSTRNGSDRALPRKLVGLLRQSLPRNVKFVLDRMILKN